LKFLPRGIGVVAFVVEAVDFVSDRVVAAGKSVGVDVEAEGGDGGSDGIVGGGADGEEDAVGGGGGLGGEGAEGEVAGGGAVVDDDLAVGVYY